MNICIQYYYFKTVTVIHQLFLQYNNIIICMQYAFIIIIFQMRKPNQVKNIFYTLII